MTSKAVTFDLSQDLVQVRRRGEGSRRGGGVRCNQSLSTCRQRQCKASTSSCKALALELDINTASYVLGIDGRYVTQFGATYIYTSDIYAEMSPLTTGAVLCKRHHRPALWNCAVYIHTSLKSDIIIITHVMCFCCCCWILINLSQFSLKATVAFYSTKVEMHIYWMG